MNTCEKIIYTLEKIIHDINSEVSVYSPDEDADIVNNLTEILDEAIYKISVFQEKLEANNEYIRNR